MTKYFAVLNVRTFIVLLISLGSCFLAINFDIRYDYDTTLISIAIIFPLVFTIRAAFSRREKAMEHLSRFKAGLMTIYYCFQNTGKINDEQKREIAKVLKGVPEVMNAYLMKQKNEVQVKVQIKSIFDFIQVHNENISGGLSIKIFRFMKDVHQGAESVMAINRHRTPVSLRAYCLLFIYIFPIIYTPAFLYKIDLETPQFILYMITVFKGFILISLYNVQDHIEHPFDQNGLDDIRLKDYELDI
ncbi:MAG: hypothetical protein AABY93_15145 [Bacteroidota bacterium]